jgi:hypothetical protein
MAWVFHTVFHKKLWVESSEYWVGSFYHKHTFWRLRMGRAGILRSRGTNDLSVDGHKEDLAGGRDICIEFVYHKELVA